MFQCHLTLCYNVVDYDRKQKERQIYFKKIKSFPVRFRYKCYISDINYCEDENIFCKKTIM